MGHGSSHARWTAAGKKVAYLLVTRGEAGIDSVAPERAGPLREAEQLAAAAQVGVHSVEFLSYRDGLIEYGPALRRDLAVAVRRHRPQLVLTLNYHPYWNPGRPNTPDHQAVGRAAIDAAGDAANRWIFPPADGEPEPWHGVRWVAVSGSPHASHAVDISAHRDRALASLSAHRTYLAALSDRPPEEYAATLLDQMRTVDSAQFDGRPYLGFELLHL